MCLGAEPRIPKFTRVAATQEDPGSRSDLTVTGGLVALPVELLRVLPDDYLRSLSPDVQAEIRRRLQRSDH